MATFRLSNAEPSRNFTQRVATLKSGDEEVRINYIEKHPLAPGSDRAKGTILLIHGFPQTSYQFRHVINPLAEAGYRVIAPDYRGAGESGKTVFDFRKSTVARDLLVLVREHLGIKEKIHVVGHDIGGMVAHAFASRFPDDTASNIWGECPLPGTSEYEENKGSVALFHFNFHAVLDLPETLVHGNEREYLKHFYDKLAYNRAGISLADLEHYSVLYSQPGAMRCGFGVYRAFEEDAEENREWVRQNGKCKVPSLVLMGEQGFLKQMSKRMAEEMYDAQMSGTVPDAGHWIAEENPEGFVKAVLEFVGKHESK